MKHTINSKIFWSFAILLSSPFSVMAQESSAYTGNYVLNIALLVLAIFLLFPLIVLLNILKITTKQSIRQNKESNSGKLTAIIVFLLFSSYSFAQESTKSVVETSYTLTSDMLLTFFLIFVVIIELGMILYLSKNINYYLSKRFNTNEEKEEKESWIEQIWMRINKLRPLSEEMSLDTGHSYDGIRELNNVTPPWFTFAFISSIIFSIIYLWVYHVVGIAPLQAEEFENEMKLAEMQKVEMLKNQKNNIDETNVKVLTGADVETGHKLFQTNCKACHGDKAQSAPNGVGPNLTDNFWLHGGEFVDIFKLIKYGFREKGMQAWNDVLTPLQIAQLASYIESVKGTNVAGGKDPQGEKYTPKSVESTATPVSDTMKSK